MALIGGVLLCGMAFAQEPGMPELLPISIENYSEIHHDPGVLTVELRTDEAVGAAMFERARRLQAITSEETAGDCLAVLIIDATSPAAEVAAAVARLAGAGCALRRLEGEAAQWIAAGLAAPALPHPAPRPGEVPFIIPRGLCEARDPVQSFNQ